MPQVKDILPPRYRAPERIAEGGMGEIYRATDEALGREVAVKILAERYASDEPLRARFTREALAAARLSGEPHTVTIFDVGEHAERPFIVMEYLAGGSLEDRLRSGRVPVAQTLEWLEETARALDAAHERGVVHRDVKPANLLLDGAGRVHVADFGIASAAGLDSMTKPGTVMGTAGYISPEQAQGERATPASDRYALAVVAFELLAGRRPFERATSTAEATAHVNDPVPSVRDVDGDLPGELDPVFARALAKDPAARWSSCGELVSELRRALDDAAGKTRVATSPVAAVSRSLGRRRSPGPFAAALVLGLLLLGGGALAAVLATGGDEPARTPSVKTVTRRGTPSVTTVTAPAPTTAPTTAAPAPQDGAALNDAGYAKMQTGDFAGALPLLEQAVQKLQGSGEIDEAYADYNLAYTRLRLGSCDGVAGLLDRSESIQGPRHEIDRLRKDARKSCGGD